MSITTHGNPQSDAKEFVTNANAVNVKIGQEMATHFSAYRKIIDDVKNMKGYSQNLELQSDIRALERFIKEAQDPTTMINTRIDPRFAPGTDQRDPLSQIAPPKEITMAEAFTQFADKIAKDLEGTDPSKAMGEMGQAVRNAESFASDFTPQGPLSQTQKAPDVNIASDKMKRLEASYDALGIPAEARPFVRGTLDSLKRWINTKDITKNEEDLLLVIHDLASKEKLDEVRKWFATAQAQSAAIDLGKKVNLELASGSGGSRLEKAAQLAHNTAHDQAYLPAVLSRINQESKEKNTEEIAPNKMAATTEQPKTTEEIAKNNLNEIEIATVTLIASWRTEMENLNEGLKKKYDAKEDTSQSIMEINKTVMTMFILAKGFKPHLPVEHQLEVTKILNQINENIASTAQYIQVDVEKAQLNPKLSSDHMKKILNAPLDALRSTTARIYNEISQTVRKAGMDPNQFWEEYNKVHERTEALARALRKDKGQGAAQQVPEEENEPILYKKSPHQEIE